MTVFNAAEIAGMCGLFRLSKTAVGIGATVVSKKNQLNIFRTGYA